MPPVKYRIVRSKWGFWTVGQAYIEEILDGQPIYKWIHWNNYHTWQQCIDHISSQEDLTHMNNYHTGTGIECIDNIFGIG